ncbi:MAG: hypothetical protein WCH74_14265 [Chloroflexota bacterium]
MLPGPVQALADRIGIGAFIHGFVPTELVVAIGGPDDPLAVPLVVLIAVFPTIFTIGILIIG